MNEANRTFDMAETTSCQEYGHLYEACVGLHCSDDNCRIHTCADCGDEYEE